MIKYNIRHRAFTLIELLTAIAIIGVLASITLATVGKVRDRAKRAQCTSNLRQIGVALTNYATENRGRLPDNTSNGAWAWDVRYDIIKRLGAPQDLEKIAYCPAGYFPEKDILWEFMQGEGGFRAIGYVLLLKGTGSLDPNEMNDRIDMRSVKNESGQTVAVVPSQRELAVDATISLGYGNFTSVQGMAPSPHRANHISRTKPDGGNIVFLDGHVQWRPFGEMRNHVITPGKAWFWW